MREIDGLDGSRGEGGAEGGRSGKHEASLSRIWIAAIRHVGTWGRGCVPRGKMGKMAIEEDGPGDHRGCHEDCSGSCRGIALLSRRGRLHGSYRQSVTVRSLLKGWADSIMDRRINRILVAVLAAIALLASENRANAQPCGGRWLPGDGVPGVLGQTQCAVSWSPDGNGPLPPMLVVGGTFAVAGPIAANDIAGWDGTSWHSFSTGMSRTGGATVLAVCEYNGDLIAGGLFTAAGGTPCANIARWDGAAWQPLGGGTNGYVRCLAVYNGELVAGGDFTTAGGASCNRIARWNGSAWQTLQDEECP